MSRIDKILTRSSDSARAHGNALCDDMENAARTQLLWLGYLASQKSGSHAKCLIDGAQSAIREAAACLILGLARPSLNSLRTQIDLTLSWLYFKDHPVEWDLIQATGENFKLKKELFQYLKDWHPKFAGRIGILQATKTRKLVDPYRLLSAHMHGQNELAVPSLKLPEDAIAKVAILKEVTAIQFECSEYISDLFWAVYADNWRSLPAALMDDLSKRFVSKKQKAEFFK